MSKVRLAIMISGRGTNMEAILDACAQPDYPAEPALVLSNRPDAAGLITAAQRGISTAAVDHKPFGKDREAFERLLHDHLSTADVELIALAGFMRILTPWFVSQWSNRLINIHPSLLPKYPGLKTHARALAAGDAEHGCSVHWVTEGVDEGDVIDQARITIKPGDTEDSLRARVLKQEHALYPRALKRACEVLLPGQ